VTTAFVLWGGGSLGAAQVGMLRSLTAAGVRADLVVGSSVGAINGVCYAAHPDKDGVEKLARAWMRLSKHDVFPLSVSASLQVLVEHLPKAPLQGVLRALGVVNHVFPLNPLTLASALLGRSNHLIDSQRFEEFLQRVLPIDELQHTKIPAEVLATDVCSGRSVPISHGPTVPAVMASTAIPAVYPNVEHDGRTLVDGEIANGTCLDRAVELGADEVYLLRPCLSRELKQPPTNVLAMAVHAYNLLSEQRLAASIAQVRPMVTLHELPPPSPVRVLPVDFTHTTELIEQAAESTDRWLRDHRIGADQDPCRAVS
jgi:NTE family protein